MARKNHWRVSLSNWVFLDSRVHFLDNGVGFHRVMDYSSETCQNLEALLCCKVVYLARGPPQRQLIFSTICSMVTVVLALSEISDVVGSTSERLLEGFS